jgi:hypothetical protein
MLNKAMLFTLKLMCYEFFIIKIAKILFAINNVTYSIRLNSLTLISIEDDFLKNLDFDQIIGHFAAKKVG